MEYIHSIDLLRPLLKDADHIDVKTVEGEVSMREFIAAVLTYQPDWMRMLYGVRAVFVRFLGMKQKTLFPSPPPMHADTVPMTPGEAAFFFTVRLAKEESYWVAEINEKHLRAGLGVIVEPLSGARRRFHVLTVVHYNNWAGPVYFNVIRPFHHLVVGSMARAGVEGRLAT